MWGHFCRAFLATVLFSAVALGAPAPTVSSTGQDRVDVIVGFDGPPNAAMVRKAGGRVRREFTIVDAVAATMPSHAAEALAKAPGVRYVELDHPVHAHWSREPYDASDDGGIAGYYGVDPYVPWGVGRVIAGDPGLGAEGYEEYIGSIGGRAGIGVAILDTGIWYWHPDLYSNIVGGYDAISRSGILTNDLQLDPGGHGTHVAGTVAANLAKIVFPWYTCADDVPQDGDTTGGGGIVGLSPKASLYAVRVLDEAGAGAISDIVDGIQWAVDSRRIDVINMSLGTATYSTTLDLACQSAFEAGILLVASAGNSGNRPGRGDNVEYPARLSTVVAVAASDISDRRASFSSTGPDVELIAPGVTVLSTLANGCTIHGVMSGTSMAAPHVTGAAALAWSVNPYRLANSDLRQVLKGTAQNLGYAQELQGYGLVRADWAITAIQAAADGSDRGGIIGSVSDATGAPLEGARVEMVGVPGSPSATTCFTHVFARGSTPYYEFADVPAGTYLLRASADGLALKEQEVTVPAVCDFTLGFDAPSVSGRVSDENTGSPVAGTIVTLQASRPPNFVAETWTNELGGYEFAAVIPDTYTITASAYDPLIDDYAASSLTVSVEPGEDVLSLDFALTPTGSAYNNPPTAAFAYDAQGLAVSFADMSVDADGTVVGWEWDFGDGSGSSVQNPAHTYVEAGDYQVTLTITDDDGATGGCSQNVTVTETIGAMLHVGSIAYASVRRDFDLEVTIPIRDDTDAPVPGATVSATLILVDVPVATVNAETGTDGTVTIYKRKAASGTYTTLINDVAADGFSWDGATPTNSYTKE